jgi:prophage antirepressor-like protein
MSDLLAEREEAKRLLQELLDSLLPTVRSQSRYSQGAQSAMIRAKDLVRRMEQTDQNHRS